MNPGTHMISAFSLASVLLAAAAPVHAAGLVPTPQDPDMARAPDATGRPLDTPEFRRPALEQLERMIVTRTPESHIVETVDHERITARRIDIVGDDGTIRMTLTGRTSGPVIDGIEYQRAITGAGILLYNAKGQERGGFAVQDVGDGVPVIAMDFPNMDAIGWRVMPDGSVFFGINQAPPLLREPGLGNSLVPGIATPTRIALTVSADGAPAVALNDARDQTRLRLTITPEGYGAIEFLNAAGQVIHVIAPEASGQ